VRFRPRTASAPKRTIIVAARALLVATDLIDDEAFQAPYNTAMLDKAPVVGLGLLRLGL